MVMCSGWTFLGGESWNTRLHTLIPAWLEIKIVYPTDKLFHHTAVSAGAHFQAIRDSEVHESHFGISFLTDIHLVNVGRLKNSIPRSTTNKCLSFIFPFMGKSWSHVLHWFTLVYTQNYGSIIICNQDLEIVHLSVCFPIIFLYRLSFCMHLVQPFHYAKLSFSYWCQCVYIALLSKKWCLLPIGIMQEASRILYVMKKIFFSVWDV